MEDSLSHIECVLQNAIKYEDERHSDINRSHLKTKLYPHQARMVIAMQQHKCKMTNGFLHEGEFITGALGIIADPPGTGKTLAVLAYLGLKEGPAKPTFGLLNTTSNRYFASHEGVMSHDISTINVVIVPPSLLQQWEQEIKTHTYLNAFVVSNRRTLNNWNSYTQLRNSDFILTTSRMWHDTYQYTQRHRIAWNNLFIDEAANIYFCPQEGIPTFGFAWLISSNWLALQFRNQHLNQRHLQSAINHFRDISDNNTYFCATESSVFYRQLIPWSHPFRYLLVLRNDSKTDYPYPSLIQSDILCRPQYTLINLPQQILGTNYSGLTHEKISSIFAALNLEYYTINTMKQIYQRADLIDSKLKDDCVICLEQPRLHTMLPCCMNLFCGACILRQLIMSGQCPTCRAPISLPSLHPLQLDQPSSENQIILRTKQDTCVDYIRRHSDISSNSFLVYTLYENTYFQIEGKLRDLGIKSDYIEQSNRGNKAVANFNSRHTKVLFISNIDAVRGLTLKATHLILFYAIPSYEREQILLHSMQRVGVSGPQHLVHLTATLD